MQLRSLLLFRWCCPERHGSSWRSQQRLQHRHQTRQGRPPPPLQLQPGQTRGCSLLQWHPESRAASLRRREGRQGLLRLRRGRRAQQMCAARGRRCRAPWLRRKQKKTWMPLQSRRRRHYRCSPERWCWRPSRRRRCPSHAGARRGQLHLHLRQPRLRQKKQKQRQARGGRRGMLRLCRCPRSQRLPASPGQRRSVDLS